MGYDVHNNGKNMPATPFASAFCAQIIAE